MLTQVDVAKKIGQRIASQIMLPEENSLTTATSSLPHIPGYPEKGDLEHGIRHKKRVSRQS